MTDDRPGAAPELEPKFEIEFNIRTSLARPISQPMIVNDPVGLVVFADSTAIYLAEVTDPGADVYKPLGSIKAHTYIHGWSVISGWLYVVDGVELTAWSIQTGKKEASRNLLEGDEAQKANNALADLQKTIQSVEWATLLEQAEDEWVRLIPQQNAAPLLSEERDRLDTQASDHFRMLRSLREMVGSTGGASAARQLVAKLRKTLAEKKLAARPWCFSAPVIRPGSMEQSQRAVFILQGNGTLHGCNKTLTAADSKQWTKQAELHMALIDFPTTKPRVQFLSFIADGKLRLVDVNSLEEKTSWAPETAPGTTLSFTSANKQVWWATDSGVLTCEVDQSGKVRPTFKSGQPWTTRQIGRLNAPPTPYKPAVNPNELFDTMNVHAWTQRHGNKPLNDGITAQLILSDASGKYTTPPEGTTHIVFGPFERDAHAAASSWTHIKAHPTKPVVLLSDSRGASVLCKYPTPANLSQLIPLWSAAPWLTSVQRYSDLDFALSHGWPTPAVRALSRPYPDMVARVNTVAASEVKNLDNLTSIGTPSRRHFGDRDLRLILWYALFDRTFPYDFFAPYVNPIIKKALPAVFPSEQVISLRERFSGLGGSWDYMPYVKGNDTYSYGKYFGENDPPVNFDPPWIWKALPPMFHSTPPAWFDPWGYNQPGDFVPQQPSATYLDPFCFDGQLRFPQRKISFDTSFKGRRWAVFTDNDPSLLLAKGKPAPQPNTLKADVEPESSALVVTADEERQRSTIQILPLKPLRITFDVPTHALRNQAPEFGSTDKHFVASPLVYTSPNQTFPVAWCVANPEFPGVRLRKLAEVTSGTSIWDRFVAENKAKYGPKPGAKAWQIDLCPLPTDALPLLVLMGYSLPNT